MTTRSTITRPGCRLVFAEARLLFQHAGPEGPDRSEATEQPDAVETTEQLPSVEALEQPDAVVEQATAEVGQANADIQINTQELISQYRTQMQLLQEPGAPQGPQERACARTLHQQLMGRGVSLQQMGLPPIDSLTQANIEHAQKYIGSNIFIEHPPGSMRYGHEVRHAYGYYVNATDTGDGERLDVIVGPNPESPSVFVMRMIPQDIAAAPSADVGTAHTTGNPENGAPIPPETQHIVFDDHIKTFFGFTSAEEVQNAFKGNYGEQFQPGPISAVPVATFQAMLQHGTASA